MKKQLTYSEAFTQLETLVEELEGGGVLLEALSAKVEEANALILICENKLRSIEESVHGKI